MNHHLQIITQSKYFSSDVSRLYKSDIHSQSVIEYSFEVIIKHKEKRIDVYLI